MKALSSENTNDRTEQCKHSLSEGRSCQYCSFLNTNSYLIVDPKPAELQVPSVCIFDVSTNMSKYC